MPHRTVGPGQTPQGIEPLLTRLTMAGALRGALVTGVPIGWSISMPGSPTPSVHVYAVRGKDRLWHLEDLGLDVPLLEMRFGRAEAWALLERLLLPLAPWGGHVDARDRTIRSVPLAVPELIQAVPEFFHAFQLAHLALAAPRFV